MAIIDRVCEWCNTPFKTEAYRLKTGRGRFCSRPCNSRFHLTGKRSRNWKGGRHRFSGGYIAVKSDHPVASVQGKQYALEHRLVASIAIGRALSPKEIVHHINGDAADNRIENLQVMTQSEHAKLHAEMRRAK